MSASQRVTQAAWDGRLDAERLVRYYRRLADRYRCRHLVMTSSIAVLSVGAGSTLMAAIHPWVGITLAFVTTATAIVLMLMDFSTKAAKAAAASKYAELLANEWTHIWWNQHKSGTTERVQVIMALELAGPEVEIGEDEKLNIRCQNEAVAVVEAEYAPAT